MLFTQDVLEAIAAGRIDLAFRRWDRPRVRTGSRLRTAVGVIEVHGISRVDPAHVSDREARRAGAASSAQLLSELDHRGDRPTYRIALRYAGPDPRVALREQADPTPEEIAELKRRLGRLDRASRHGPWTAAVLQLILQHPATRAAELAAELGRDTPSFKRDVRKLKELGLTESLEVGYRLTPRGLALLAQDP